MEICRKTLENVCGYLYDMSIYWNECIYCYASMNLLLYIVYIQ